MSKGLFDGVFELVVVEELVGLVVHVELVFFLVAAHEAPCDCERGDDGDDGVEGITIQNVFANSPAAKAGLEIGDILTHINGKPYTKKQVMIIFVKSHSVGDKLNLTLLRGENEIVQAKVTLGSLHFGIKEMRSPQVFIETECLLDE